MWKSVSCEVQGRGHITANVPCQDKTLAVVRKGVNIIALADGAGSSKLSHFGAKRAIASIVQFVSENFVDLLNNGDGQYVKRQILKTVRHNLEIETVKRECKLCDLASTLLVVAVFEDKYLIVHVGDGVIGYLVGEELKVASFPDNGEFSNITTFVTSSEALTSMRLFKGDIKDIAGFVIMSDGTEQSLYHKQTKSLAKVTVKLMQRTCLLGTKVMKKQLLATFNSVISKNTQDDCSIAILARPVGILNEYSNLNLLEKLDILGLSNQALKKEKRVRWFDDLINFLETPQSLDSISMHMNLQHPTIQERIIKKRIAKLIKSGLVTMRDSLYIKSD